MVPFHQLTIYAEPIVMAMTGAETIEQRDSSLWGAHCTVDQQDCLTLDL